jgi:hypothetical protein
MIKFFKKETPAQTGTTVTVRPDITITRDRLTVKSSDQGGFSISHPMSGYGISDRVRLHESDLEAIIEMLQEYKRIIEEAAK